MKGVGNDDDDDGNKTRIREDNNKININSIYQRYDEDDNGGKKSYLFKGTIIPPLINTRNANYPPGPFFPSPS